MAQDYSNDDRTDFKIDSFPSVESVISDKEIKKENRKDLLHKITHCLAVLVLITFLGLMIYQIVWRSSSIIMPDYFISIVSVIVGFYFARSLPE